MSSPNWERLALLLAEARKAAASGCFNYQHYFYRAEGRGGGQPPPVEHGEVDWCGTTACFAGHAITLWENDLWIKDSTGLVEIEESIGTHYTDVASDLLGLSPVEAHWLFIAIPDEDLDGDDPAHPEDMSDKDFHDLLQEVLDHTGVSKEALGLAYLEECVAAKQMRPIYEVLSEILSGVLRIPGQAPA